MQIENEKLSLKTNKGSEMLLAFLDWLYKDFMSMTSRSQLLTEIKHILELVVVFCSGSKNDTVVVYKDKASNIKSSDFLAILIIRHLLA